MGVKTWHDVVNQGVMFTHYGNGNGIVVRSYCVAADDEFYYAAVLTVECASIRISGDHRFHTEQHVIFYSGSGNAWMCRDSKRDHGEMTYPAKGEWLTDRMSRAGGRSRRTFDAFCDAMNLYGRDTLDWVTELWLI